MSRYCTKCGTQIIEGAKFCSRCGIKILQQPIIQSQQTPIQSQAVVQQ